MPKSYFLPADEAGKRTWLNNFAAKLPTYAAIVGVTSEEVAQEAADAVFFDFVCDAHNQHMCTSQDWTAYKKQAAHGSTLGGIPVTPDLGTPPPAVPPNIFGRASALAARIKKHPSSASSRR
jgi:hypothetical protein